jgi:aerobic-type carbon monoxide dehydrogenase small subunit (CoxS/CutS family)
MGEHNDDVSFTCVVNGTETALTGDPASAAATALRARGLFSVRETCGLGVCGTCTVLLDGEPVSSCILPLYAVEGRTLQTAEGLERDGRLTDLQEQFIEKQAFQCSFCTPGFLMSGTALLRSADGEISDEQIVDGLQGHLCRCGCYASIKEAVSACAGRSAKCRREA